MRVRFADRVWMGRAVDLNDVAGNPTDAGVDPTGASVDPTGAGVDPTGAGVDPAHVLAAVRGDPIDSSTRIEIECPPPGPVHDEVGLVAPTSTVDRRRALAEVARSRGHRAPQRDELERVRAELAAIDPPTVDLEAARARAARTGEERHRLRERVAAQRGRVQARREAGLDATAAESELADVVARLSETETECAAAEQALERARRLGRDARDVRERRLRLEDREANLERRARAWLADQVRPAADRGVRAAPVETADTDADSDPGSDAASDAASYAEAGPVTASLAAVRVADVEAPVVLACGRFDDATAAEAWLDAPVIRCPR